MKFDWKKIKNWASTNDSNILTGVGIVLTLGAVAAAVKGTVKAVKHIDAKKNELDVSKLTKKQTFQACWKDYIPTTVLLVGGTACIIASDRLQWKNNLKLTEKLIMSESVSAGLSRALATTENTMVKELGEEKAKEISGKAHDEVRKEHMPNATNIYLTDEGDVLMFDSVSGTYFRSTKEAVEHNINVLNQRMLGGGEMTISINEYLCGLNINKRIAIGEMAGWNASRLIEPTFTPSECNGELCYDISYMANGAPCTSYNE